MKTKIEDLGLFGGSPIFKEKLHVGRPNIWNRDKLLEYVNDILDRRWLTNNGLYVQEFENKIAHLLGVKHCIAMCNATIALEITIRALGLTGEVIVPSMTFIATAHSLQWQGIRPVFCDIHPPTHNIDVEAVERMITPHTTGIIGVHLWGRPCDTEALQSLAQKHSIKLLFDAAHAFGCSRNGIMIGNFGSAEVFSFHATKFLNTFEGGAVATNDDDLAKKIRLMKNFGFTGYDNVIYIGTNGKMNEISAAMGIAQLDGLDQLIAINYKNYKHYEKKLAHVPGIRLINYDESEKCNFQYIVVEFEATARLSRDQIMDVLHSENILVRRYFYPGCHKMEPYRSLFPHAGAMLPFSESLLERVLVLPTGTSVQEDDISKICELIWFLIRNSDTVRELLNKIL